MIRYTISQLRLVEENWKKMIVFLQSAEEKSTSKGQSGGKKDVNFTKFTKAT